MTPEQVVNKNTPPTIDESTKAMLKQKTKFMSKTDKFSSRKYAYKRGWQDCYNWIFNTQKPKQ